MKVVLGKFMAPCKLVNNVANYASLGYNDKYLNRIMQDFTCNNFGMKTKLHGNVQQILRI